MRARRGVVLFEPAISLFGSVHGVADGGELFRRLWAIQHGSRVPLRKRLELVNEAGALMRAVDLDADTVVAILREGIAAAGREGERPGEFNQGRAVADATLQLMNKSPPLASLLRGWGS